MHMQGVPDLLLQSTTLEQDVFLIQLHTFQKTLALLSFLKTHPWNMPKVSLNRKVEKQISNDCIPPLERNREISWV